MIDKRDECQAVYEFCDYIESRLTVLMYILGALSAPAGIVYTFISGVTWELIPLTLSFLWGTMATINVYLGLPKASTENRHLVTDLNETVIILDELDCHVISKKETMHWKNHIRAERIKLLNEYTSTRRNFFRHATETHH